MSRCVLIRSFDQVVDQIVDQGVDQGLGEEKNARKYKLQFYPALKKSIKNGI